MYNFHWFFPLENDDKALVCVGVRPETLGTNLMRVINPGVSWGVLCPVGTFLGSLRPIRHAYVNCVAEKIGKCICLLVAFYFLGSGRLSKESCRFISGLLS